jgi:hypothetical protein
MTVSVTLVSEHDVMLRLVHDFARGLGCSVEMETTSSGRSIRIELDDADHRLVELLAHVALSAAKVGVDVSDSLCHLTYRHPGVTSNVTLTLRITELRIDTAAEIGS